MFDLLTRTVSPPYRDFFKIVATISFVKNKQNKKHAEQKHKTKKVSCYNQVRRQEGANLTRPQGASLPYIPPPSLLPPVHFFPSLTLLGLPPFCAGQEGNNIILIAFIFFLHIVSAGLLETWKKLTS